MTDDMVNLLCHFVGNRMISHFWKCDLKYKKVKQNMSVLLTWTPGTSRMIDVYSRGGIARSSQLIQNMIIHGGIVVN